MSSRKESVGTLSCGGKDTSFVFSKAGEEKLGTWDLVLLTRLAEVVRCGGSSWLWGPIPGLDILMTMVPDMLCPFDR